MQALKTAAVGMPLKLQAAAGAGTIAEASREDDFCPRPADCHTTMRLSSARASM
jgi:hypothetical protein